VSEFEAKRLAPIDGLRGIAILSVMFYHFCFVPTVSNNILDLTFYRVGMMGWIGVDLFFVISGFLITRILLATRESSRYFQSFYARRILRIFPLYYGYLIALTLAFAVAARFPAIPAEKIAGGFQGQLWLWIFLSNLGMFAKGSALSPVTGHFWSLAVEEQFYLFWPLIVYLLARETLLKVTVGLIVLALAVRSVLTASGFSDVQVYVFTLSRIDALAWGSIVAILIGACPTDRLLKCARGALFAVVPISALALIYWGPRPGGDPDPLLFSVGLSIFPILFAAIVAIAVLDADSLISRSLDRGTLKFFGKYSYGLYVLHVIIRAVVLVLLPAPIVLWGTQLAWQLAFMTIGGGISVGAAFLSWHLYESQFLKLKRYFPYAAKTRLAFFTNGPRNSPATPVSVAPDQIS
jgi:peptidoglycan/LPS O-acetylase OafA/YrhL